MDEVGAVGGVIDERREPAVGGGQPVVLERSASRLAEPALVPREA